MKREVALEGTPLRGNFRGVCPYNGRRNLSYTHEATCGIVVLSVQNLCIYPEFVCQMLMQAKSVF